MSSIAAIDRRCFVPVTPPEPAFRASLRVPQSIPAFLLTWRRPLERVRTPA